MRKPFYHPQHDQYRVVYRPSNSWVAQVLTSKIPSRECDPWEDLHSPKETKEQAIRIMYQRMPFVEQKVVP